ncbi:uncharacterized protein LOC121379930 [Gigantopelta aegis]|uniref:uncharacterized protein LOC121379930 n=1 Tax=Gigantopelta aegis TaxID=1735272 RepID=UPI001B88DC7A|nr:uncharacterized protein LOC121379930 [Gigantopelta aegis]
MNEIIIRSNKGEYFPGEVICGVVYLNIENPTSGHGIQLQFKGYEYFFYEYSCEKGRNKIESTKDYVDCSVSLYSQSDSFAMGSYLFPFKVNLPNIIPGCFYARRNGSVTWEGKVVYWLEATVTGADIKSFQDIVIYQCTEDMVANEKLTTAQNVTHTMKTLLSKKNIDFTVRLMDQVQYVGESARLRMIITNDTNVKVSKFQIKLFRDLNFTSKSELSADKLTSNMSSLARKTYIRAEDGPFVVWKIVGNNTDSDSVDLVRILDNILIPLKEKSVPIPPSVKGHHIECQYGLEILITLSNGETVTINHPVPCILPPKNKQWESWEVPTWVYTGEVVISSSRFSATSSELSGRGFATLPGFQAL